MSEDKRLDDCASAWADADHAAIFLHVLDLKMALRDALFMVRNSAYAPHMKETLTGWQCLLEAWPPRRLDLP